MHCQTSKGRVSGGIESLVQTDVNGERTEKKKRKKKRKK